MPFSGLGARNQLVIAGIGLAGYRAVVEARCAIRRAHVHLVVGQNNSDRAIVVQAAQQVPPRTR